jgi:hypothetical protein
MMTISEEFVGEDRTKVSGATSDQYFHIVNLPKTNDVCNIFILVIGC